MLAREINPFVRRAFTLTRTPYNKLVKCADCRLSYVLRGSGELTVGNSTYPVSAGCLGLWKSGTEYCWNFSKKQKVSLVIINFDYTQDYCNRTKALSLIPKSAFEHKKILTAPEFEDIGILNSQIFLGGMNLFKNPLLDIVSEFENQKLFSSELAGAMLHQLILKVAAYASSRTRTHSKIEPIIEYIQTNYSREITNISPGKMANYHPHYINLLMKEYTGTTLHTYLTDYRMNEALKLLVNTDDSIETVSQSVGFKNPTHFCKIFKNKFGISPSAYRKASRLV